MKIHLKRYNPHLRTFGLLLLFILSSGGYIIPAPQGGDYSTPGRINSEIKKIAGSNGAITKIHNLALSPGGTELLLLEIGTETASSDRKKPAVLDVGNPD